MEEKTGEPTTSTAPMAYLPYSNNNPHSYQQQDQQQQQQQQQYQMHTVSPPYNTADNNGGTGVSATEIHHHSSGSGSVGYTSLNGGGGDGEERQLEGSVDNIPGKGPGGVPDKYFTLEFEDCFTEPKGTKAIPGLYKVLNFIYKYTKLVFYHIFVILIGIPLTILWAFCNGIMVFVLVWMWGPVLRVFIVWVYALSPAFSTPVRALLSPLVDVLGRIFRQIHINANVNGNVGQKLGGQEHTA